uniref:Uncharacterized protein n=1 Tax=Amphimedon queenslandica TaxID=400682 RepID=A0A1X7U9L0_AMPQE
MPFWSVTEEKAEELLQTRDKKEVEEREHQEESAGAAIVVKKKGKERQTKLTGSATKGSTSAAVTKPSAFAEVVTPEIPEFCAEKVKKERATKSQRAKADDPGQIKLPFNSIEEMTTNETGTKTVKDEKVKDEKVKKSAEDSHTSKKEPSPTDASQTTLKFHAESKKRVYHFSSDSSEDDAVSDHHSDDIFIASLTKKATKTTKTKKQAVADEVPTKTPAVSKTKKQLSVKVTSVKTDTNIKKPVTKGASSKVNAKETEIDDDVCIIDEGSPVKKNTKAKSTKAKAPKRKVSDSESDTEVHVVPVVESPVCSKHSGEKVKYYFSDDDDDDYNDSDFDQ